MKRVRDIIFYGMGTVSLGLQAYVMIMSQVFWSSRKHTGIYNDISGMESLFLPLEGTLNNYFRTLLGVLYYEVDGFSHVVTVILITIIFILLACYFLYRKKRFMILYFFGLSQIIVIGLLYFIFYSSPIPFKWENMQIITHRWWAYSNFVMYLSIMVLAYNLVQEIISRVSVNIMRTILSSVSVIALSLFAIHFSIYDFYRNNDPYGGYDSLSNWEKYRHLLKEDDYYIPANPVMSLQWQISKDNGKLNIDLKADGFVTGIKLSQTEGELKLRSLIVVNHDYYDSMKDLIIKAYDKDMREIAIPVRLNNFRDKYLYYYFTERIRPYSLLFFKNGSNSWFFNNIIIIKITPFRN